ncbi:MAG: hypothetical protein EOP92_09600 [Lysobacteraceae bacterium]|nr:MAG: hypothetical protein EOP92_09600 [Xanthomonadaceae bacterium]
MSIPTELLAAMSGRLAPGGGPATAADAVRVWRTLFQRFDPLLGPLSTALLFVRAMDTQAAAFPWLPQTSAAESAQTAFDRFAHSLDGRSPDDILAVNRVLLAAFTAHMSELIGAGLTTRFLRAAFPPGGVQEE